MKLIIDIDDEEYNRFKKAEIKGYVSTQIPISTIMNGTPLDDLRAEIEQYNLQPSHFPCDMISIGVVLQIIDKHMKGVD